MPKKSRKPSEKAWLWKNPSLVTLILLIVIAIAAAMVQRGAIKADSIKAVLLGGAILAGLVGAVNVGKGEQKPIQIMLGPGIPALLLTAAIILVRGEGDKKWSMAFILLLLIPGICRVIFSREKGGRRHRSEKKKR